MCPGFLVLVQGRAGRDSRGLGKKTGVDAEPIPESRGRTASMLRGIADDIASSRVALA